MERWRRCLALGQDVAAHAGAGDLLVQLGGQLVQLGRVLPGRVGLVALLLGLGAVADPGALHVVGLVGGDDGLGVQVPALAALGRPQGLGPLGAGRADRGEGVPARDEHLLDLAGLHVGAAELDGPDAAAVLDGQVADDIAGQRHGQPLGRVVRGVIRPPSRRGRSGRRVGGVPGERGSRSRGRPGSGAGRCAGVEQRAAAVGAVLAATASR